MAQMTKAGLFILWALKQVGKVYVLGAEAKLTPANFSNLDAFRDQSAWDCSECTQAGLWAAGVEQVTDSNGRAIPISAFDGAGFQWERSRSIPLADAVRLPGALLFVRSAAAYPRKPHHVGHVAIVIAKDTILEARGKRWGVTIGPVRPSFNLASKVQELYTPA